MSVKQVTLVGIDGSEFTITGDPDDPGTRLPDCCLCHGFPIGGSLWKAEHDYGYTHRSGEQSS